LESQSGATPGDHGISAVIGILEEQLAVLDRLGMRLAAAHLDAAIQQLRLDIARR
jgi:hypothetical protein